ncbi:MAG: hypothetical protein K6F29_01545 [Bacteroidales bacterium]|nr:hypothetical protein [Bacteroidales bacterium]
MRFFRKSLIIILLLTTIIACHRKPSVVVSVYDKSLTVEDLQNMLPAYSDAEDSALVTQQFINAWIEQQVMYHEAKTKLSVKEMDFSKEIEDYTQMLAIHTYENKYVNAKITRASISEEEIENYYKSHLSDFQLKQNIIKVNFVKFPIDHPQIEPSKNLLFKQRSQAEDAKLEQLVNQYAYNFYLKNNWLLFEDIIKEIPIRNYSEEQFSAQKRHLVMNDSTYTYLVNIIDFKVSEGISPLSMVKEKIIDILLQQKRMSALKDLRSKAMGKAKNKGEILY